MQLIRSKMFRFFTIFLITPFIFMLLYSDTYSRGMIIDYATYFSGIMFIFAGFAYFFIELANIQMLDRVGDWIILFFSLFFSVMVYWLIAKAGSCSQHSRWISLTFFLISLINGFIGRLILVASYQ